MIRGTIERKQAVVPVSPGLILPHHLFHLILLLLLFVSDVVWEPRIVPVAVAPAPPARLGWAQGEQLCPNRCFFQPRSPAEREIAKLISQMQRPLSSTLIPLISVLTVFVRSFVRTPLLAGCLPAPSLARSLLLLLACKVERQKKVLLLLLLA